MIKIRKGLYAHIDYYHNHKRKITESEKQAVIYLFKKRKDLFSGGYRGEYILRMKKGDYRDVVYLVNLTFELGRINE